MFKKPSAMTVFICIVGIGFAAIFDRAMRIDADNLCASDATAYDGCADR